MSAYGQYEVPTVDKCVNFKIGQPADDMLPLELVRKAAADKFSETDPLFLQYGNIYGFPLFRKSLATFLTKQYSLYGTNTPVDPEQLLATNGNTGALSLILSLFCHSGDIILAEEPTYFLAKRIFEDYKLQCVQIPMDVDGVQVDKLEELLVSRKQQKLVQPKVMYVVTTAHNPTGRTLTRERRVKLVALAKAYGFLLICDEVYQLLTFPGVVPPPPMFTFDQPEGDTVLGLGSFSKILCPALRVGWIHAGKGLLKKIADCGQLDSSGGLNPVCYGIVQKFIDNGFLDSHLQSVRNKLQERYEVLSQALTTHLPKGVTYEVPQGGYFVLVKLPEGEDATKLLQVAEKYKVAFLPGGGFAQNMKNYFRLSFSMYSAQDIGVGVDRLCQAIKEYEKAVM